MGNLTSFTKPEGNCRIMAYDEFNRLITVVVDDPTGRIGNMTALDPRCTNSDGFNLTTRYAYDANDNQTHQYDPKGNHVEFTYDALNRKTAQIQHKQGGNLVPHRNTRPKMPKATSRKWPMPRARRLPMPMTS